MCVLIYNYIHRCILLVRILSYRYYLCVKFSKLLVFSVEDNSSTAFHTKFLRSTRQVLPKKFWTNRQKMVLLVVVYEERYSKFYVALIFRALLENCHRLDLDTCVRRPVTKNGEFWGSSISRYLTQKRFCERFVLNGVDYKLLEMLCTEWCRL